MLHCIAEPVLYGPEQANAVNHHSPTLSCNLLKPPVNALIRRGPVRFGPLDLTVSTISY